MKHYIPNTPNTRLVFELANLLTEFQYDILQQIQYWVKTKGEYQYNRKYIYECYSESKTPDEIDNEINWLLDNKFISKSTKRVLLNGKYVTKTNFTLEFDAKYTIKVVEDAKTNHI